MRTEIRLFGGDLDGMLLLVNDQTMAWPIAITFDIPEVDEPLVTFKRLRYVQFHSDENADGSDSWSDYEFQESTTIKCDPFDPMLCLPPRKRKPETDSDLST
jgi:hypothetical protein